MQGFDPHKAHVEVAHPYLTMMGLFLGGFTGMFSETSLNIALPQLTEAFGVDMAVMQWLIIGYMLVIGLVLPFASLLMKWFSVRKLTLFALGAFFIGSLMSGFAPSFEVMLAGRFVQGIGTGLVLPMMFSVILEVFPPAGIGKAMGVSALIIMAAPAAGPTLSGIILGALSWRFVFFAFAVVLAVAMVFAAKFLVNPYELTRPAVDVPSCALSCLGFGGVVLGAGLASLYGWTSVEVLGSLTVGAVCLALYAYRQLHMEVPVLDVRVFTQQGYRVGVALVMLNFGITLSAMYLLPQYIQSGMLLPVATAGVLMLPGGIVNCAVSVIAGGLYDRIGARIPARVGFALSIVAAVMFLLATPDSPVAYVVAAHIVLMIGVPLAMSPSQTSALNSLPHRMNADGSTMMNTLQQVLGAIATAVATSLLGMGQAASAEGGAVAFTNGVHWGFAFTLVLAVAALALSMLLKKRSYADEGAESVPAGAPHGAGGLQSEGAQASKGC